MNGNRIVKGFYDILQLVTTRLKTRSDFYLNLNYQQQLWMGKLKQEYELAIIIIFHYWHIHVWICISHTLSWKYLANFILRLTINKKNKKMKKKQCFRVYFQPWAPIKWYEMPVNVFAVNLMWFNNAIWRHKTWSTLVWVMACRLLSAKSLPETTDP